MSYLSNIKRSIANLFSTDANLFNEAFLYAVGGGYTAYDPNYRNYLHYGYEVNPIVFAVINQMATKTAAIPYYIKEIEDKQSMESLKMISRATSGDMTPHQKVRFKKLQNKALSDTPKPFPMERPNPNQNWAEFFALYKTFLKITGNAYIYMLAPEEGQNKGQPIAVYLLPAQDVRIVVKNYADIRGIDNPVEGYIMEYGRSYIEFPAENVIHIKYPNPDYGINGEHLYGVSPLRAALRNIQATNTGLDLNIKTLKNGGAFGFIHGKTQAITMDQAAEIKERLIEMNNSPEDLGRIAGVSAEMGFTRLSLTSDELKPFDYFKFDEKQICNVLGWSDKLLNNDDGAKYDNVKEYRKQVITDNILPDLKLLEEAFNNYFIPRFKGYENSVMYFDITELPEMQEDIIGLSTWLNAALDRGVISRNEYRQAINYDEVDNENMDTLTVATDILTLEEAIESEFSDEQTQV